jgi:hypothetical protein
MQLRVDLAPHVSCLLYLQSQHLDQTLLGVYSTEYCIYVDQVGEVSYDESPCHLGTTVVYSVKDARYYSCPVLLLVDRSQLE